MGNQGQCEADDDFAAAVVRRGEGSEPGNQSRPAGGDLKEKLARAEGRVLTAYETKKKNVRWKRGQGSCAKIEFL